LAARTARSAAAEVDVPAAARLTRVQPAWALTGAGSSRACRLPGSSYFCAWPDRRDPGLLISLKRSRLLVARVDVGMVFARQLAYLCLTSFSVAVRHAERRVVIFEIITDQCRACGSARRALE
jgi:hypothetical protein